MSPSVDPTSEQVIAPVLLVPSNLLGAGEIVILAIKPSPWFVPITSLPVLLASAFLAGTALAVNQYRLVPALHAVYFVCTFISLARLTAAAWVWLGRTYVLTNRRIVAITGLLQFRVNALLLPEVAKAMPAASWPERATATGGIFCFLADYPTPAVTWQTIARPDEVNDIIQEALRRARGGHLVT